MQYLNTLYKDTYQTFKGNTQPFSTQFPKLNQGIDNRNKIMWSDYFRIIISILLSIAFFFIFGSGFIKKYLKGGTTIVQDQIVTRLKDIPLPGTIQLIIKCPQACRCHFKSSLWLIQLRWIEKGRFVWESLIFWAVLKMMRGKLLVLVLVNKAIQLAT